MGSHGVRILFYYESLDLGGQQTQTFQLVRRFAQAGHQVAWVYSAGSALEEHTRPFASLVRIPFHLGRRAYRRYPHRVLLAAVSLSTAIRDFGADVVVSGSGIGSLVAGLATLRSRTPHYRLVGCSLRQVERTLYRFYRVLCIDSLIDGYFGWPAVLRELRRKGVPERKLHVVENAVDTQMFAPLAADEREAVRRRLGIAQDEFVIGWVGRISLDMQVRNTVLLVEALARRGLGRLRLLVVGGGPWEEGLRQMLVGLSLDKLAILTGWVPMEDVNELIAAMDVVPLLEEDPQGGSIVREAMACGRVALSVDGASGTQRRFMLPGCAFLVPTDGFIEEAADVVEQLVARPRLVAATGVAARAYACEEMSFDRQVKALSDVFTSVGKQR